MKITYAGFNEKQEMNEWDVTIDSAWSLKYYTGLEIKGTPTEKDVWWAMASDALTVRDTNGFSDWCAELGYNDDSIKALNIYKACKRTYLRMETRGVDLEKLARED